MNKTFKIILGIVIVVLVGVGIYMNTTPKKYSIGDGEAGIRMRVAEFGSKMKNVSLLSPNVGSEMDKNYSEYVSPELLAAWKADPTKALGRAVSSPWPDRIEIVEITMMNRSTYKVEGNVIEITSPDRLMEPAAVYPITLTVNILDGKINSAVKGAYSELPKRITIVGVFECLPHRDTTGPQTEECAYGVKSEDNKHYALDFSTSSVMNEFQASVKVRVEGVLTPIEMISSNSWQKYPIEGILRVTSVSKL